MKDRRWAPQLRPTANRGGGSGCPAFQTSSVDGDRYLGEGEGKRWVNIVLTLMFNYVDKCAILHSLNVRFYIILCEPLIAVGLC